MDYWRLQIGPKEARFSLLTILAAVVFTVAGVKWGFLIPFGTIFAILTIIVIVLNIKVGIVLLLCSYFYVRPIYYLPFSILTYIRLDDVIWVLVVVSWVVNARKIKRGMLQTLPLSISLALLLVIAALSGVRVFTLTPALISIGNFVWFLIRLFQYVSVYFIVGTIDFTDRERSSLFTLMILSGIAVAAIVFLQYWDIVGLIPDTRYVAGAGAITATFTFKSHIGVVAMVLALLVVDKTIRQKWNPLLGFLLMGCFSVLLLITQSRAAWVAFLVGMLVYLVSMRGLQSKVIWAAILLVAGVLLFGSQGSRDLYNSHPIIDLTTGKLSQDGAISSRLTSLPLIFRYLGENPDVVFVGVGFMNWKYTLLDATAIYYGHNNYIAALVELGVLGLIAFCYFLWQGLLTAWKNIKLKRPYAQYYLSVLIGLCAASLFEDVFWPEVAQESFLAFFLLISALSIPSVQPHPRRVQSATGVE